MTRQIRFDVITGYARMFGIRSDSKSIGHVVVAQSTRSALADKLAQGDWPNTCKMVVSVTATGLLQSAPTSSAGI